MFATHNVKINGVWHRAGSNISADSMPEKNEQKTQYSKTDINRMSTAQLREVAKNTGVEGAEEITGIELKKILFDTYGL